MYIENEAFRCIHERRIGTYANVFCCFQCSNNNTAHAEFIISSWGREYRIYYLSFYLFRWLNDPLFYIFDSAFHLY